MHHSYQLKWAYWVVLFVRIRSVMFFCVFKLSLTFKVKFVFNCPLPPSISLIMVLTPLPGGEWPDGWEGRENPTGVTEDEGGVGEEAIHQGVQW